MRKSLLIIMVCITLLAGCFYKKNDSKEAKKNIDNDDIKENKIPEEYNDNGIFKDYYNQAYNMLMNMNKEEKVGQMLFARLPQSDVEGAIKNYHLGGFILFKVDFDGKTKDQVKNEINSYQKASKIPLLLGVDEEGGTVVRISSNANLYPSKFKSPQQVYQENGMDGIIDDTVSKAQLLKELGLNVNLAPVADVSTNPNDYIYNRSFGKNAEETANYITNVVNKYNEFNIGCTLKHFPGYGNNVDTHTGIAIDNRDYQTFLDSDFVPFKAGIDANVPSILVSHNVVTNIDNAYPASLSKKVHQILRDDLHFTGVIMTDDLAMKAITNYTDNPSVQAVLAGNDLIITTDYQESFESILKALNDGEIDEDIINRAVLRILAWKYKLGLIK